MAQTYEQRRMIEERIIRRVIEDALKDETIELRVEDDKPRSRDADDLYSDVVAVDEAHLRYYRKGSQPPYGTVLFVMGNDGWDVIADYTTNLEPVLIGAQEMATDLEEEEGNSVMAKPSDRANEIHQAAHEINEIADKAGWDAHERVLTLLCLIDAIWPEEGEPAPSLEVFLSEMIGAATFVP